MVAAILKHISSYACRQGTELFWQKAGSFSDMVGSHILGADMFRSLRPKLAIGIYALVSVSLAGCAISQKTPRTAKPQINTSSDQGGPGGLGVLQPFDQQSEEGSPQDGLQGNGTDLGGPIEVTGEKEGIDVTTPQAAQRPLVKAALLLPLSGRDAGSRS